MKRLFALCFILILFTGCTNFIGGLYVRVQNNDSSGASSTRCRFSTKMRISRTSVSEYIKRADLSGFWRLDK